MRILVLVVFLFLNAINSFGEIDKIRVCFTDDPSSTASIIWNQVSGSGAKLYIDVYDGGTDISNYAFVAEPTVTYGFKDMNTNIVRLKELKPATEYYFVIHDSEGTSKRYFFKTLPDNPDSPLSIIAGGDSRTFRDTRVKANKMVAKMKPDVIFFAGDFTAKGTGEEWRGWFDDWQYSFSEEGQIFPLITARGNHEYTNKDMWKLFDVPKKKVYYNLRIGGNLLALTTLNTEIMKMGPQTWWAEKALKNSQDCLWSFVQYHKPARPHIARKPEGKGQYKLWVPKMEKYGVQVVIESDSHTHKVTWPIRSDDEGEEGFVRDDEKGIVYVGEGCWGAPVQTNDDDKSWTRDSDRINQFKWIILTKDQATIRTVLYEKVDSFNPKAELTIWNMHEYLPLRKMNSGDYDVNVKNWKSN